jgi:cholesterol transport system auxiliary component
VKRRVFLSGSLALGVSACTLGRGPSDYADYDLGPEPPPAAQARLAGSWALDEVAANGWLQSRGILYRLMYRDPARLQAYALSRWTASPALLVTQRLRSALGASADGGVAMLADGAATDHVLKVGLESFEQLVQSANSSQAVVVMRALLLDGKTRDLRGQQVFRTQEPCPSVDAEGAVRALKPASDRAVAALVDWLAAAGRERG